MSTIEHLEQVELEINYRQKVKKMINLVLSVFIIIMGISVVIFVFQFDQEGLLTFRWLTVDGTIFTTVMTIFFVGVNIVEITKNTEMSKEFVYFARISSAVAEGIIMTVVLISQFPVFEQHMHILRYDMFCMHIAIPILTIGSFLLNDTPIGKLHFNKIIIGTAFVTVYVIIIISLISGGVIVKDKIPYFFLDFKAMGTRNVVLGFLFIYGLGYFFSWGLSNLNRKLYWKWFKNIVKK